jgi:hypothetical protein
MNPTNARDALRSPNLEPCPGCGLSDRVRPKLTLIDEAWTAESGEDPRLAYISDLRVDDLKAEIVKDAPLQQFVDGFYCDRCAEGFIPDTSTKDAVRPYSGSGWGISKNYSRKKHP